MQRRARWPFWAALGITAFAAIAIAFGLNAGELASWVQAVGSVAAIVATGLFVKWQHGLEMERLAKSDAELQRRSQATLVLGLQGLASELRRMSVLSGFQLEPGHQVVYPDVSAEFRSIAAMLERLPLELIVLMGKLEVFLDLRRAAAELAFHYDAKPTQGSGFYHRNRDTLYALERLCGQHARALSQELHLLAPDVYEKNEKSMHRL